jgi:spore coat polysaccharide biosynthesis protein SpsF
MNIVVIVQARTQSTRLPEKIFKPILGKAVLTLQMERVLAAELPNKVVIATTTDASDYPIVSLCKRSNYDFICGHPMDLLDRHYQASKHFNADIVVKIPSDCPLIDPKIIDKVIGYYLDNSNDFDFVSNLHPATYPDGNDVEVMSFNVLEKAWRAAKADYEREHTTPYIWDNPNKFRVGNVLWESGLDYSMTHRFTIDYLEDYFFVKAVYQELYPINKLFTLEDILYLLNNRSDIYKINLKYAGVNWYRHHLDDLRTVDSQHTKEI